MKTQVVHITGVGHSGSTVLDIALGHHPEIESVGELHKVQRSGWVISPNRRCSCGQPVHLCAYWQEVRRHWQERAGEDAVSEYIGLQNRFEWSRRCWPRLLRERRAGSDAFRRYVEMTTALYEAIRSATGRTVIVDSSKNPMRPFAFAASERLDVRVLHLVRDGRGVVWSQMKPRPQDAEGGIPEEHEPLPSWRTTLRWLVRNLECEWLARRLGPEHYLRVSYEIFTRDPEGVCADIGGFLGRDLGGLGAHLAAGGEVAIEHLVAGNALRMQGRFVLRAVSDWTRKLPARDRRLFWILAGWLARRYGYAQ